MQDLGTFTVHTAAPPIGAVQRCATCGYVLEDWTAALEGRVMVASEDGNNTLPWWPVGQLIAQSGSVTVTLPSRPLEDDEQICSGVN